MTHSILVDGREFVVGRRTGIGRFLEGLLLSLTARHPDWRVTVALSKQCALPDSLEGKADSLALSRFPELCWPALANGYDLFLSPYPKLPIRDLPCPAIHTVHDVFYLTHPAYCENRLRRAVSLWWLKRSLSKASLTWFDSEVSQRECASIAGELSHDNVIRYPAVESSFEPDASVAIPPSPFFLYVGNGLPHKNIMILMRAISGTELHLTCVGVSPEVGRQLLADSDVGPEQVDFLQGINDDQLLKLYRQATALLLPSTAEGYGYPPLEAMACGTPAIVSDIAVLRETSGGVATYCSSSDAEAWRSEMLAIQDIKLRADRVERGRVWVRQHQGDSGWAEHLADIEQLVMK